MVLAHSSMDSPKENDSEVDSENHFGHLISTTELRFLCLLLVPRGGGISRSNQQVQRTLLCYWFF